MTFGHKLNLSHNKNKDLKSTDKKMNKSRKEREKERHRNEIIDAGESLFLSQGYDNTTMEEIAQEAEFAKGTLYNYFESKEDLYLAIGTKAYEFMVNITKKFTQEKDPGIEQLMAVGYAYYEFTKTYPQYATIFHDIASRMPELSLKKKDDLTKAEKKYFEKVEEYRDIFIGVISASIQNKKIRADVDPMMIGIALSSISSGFIKEITQNRDFLNNVNLDRDEVVDFVFDMIAEGLKPKKNKNNK